MEKRQILGMIALLLVTAAVLVYADSGAGAGKTEMQQEETMSSEETRKILDDYFADWYSEAGCSAIYVDLTHDGVEELLVLEIGVDRGGEPIMLHGGAVDADRFADGRVVVCQAEKGGVTTLYEYTCGMEPDQQGGLYLQKQEGFAWLLRSAPGGEMELFALGEGIQPPAEILLQGAKPILVYEKQDDFGVTFAYLDELFTTY